MEHAASPSLMTLVLTTDHSSEGPSIRWGLAASFILHTFIIVMAMFVRFQPESEQPFRAIDVALISLPAMPMTAPSPKPVPTPTKKIAVAKPPLKVAPPSSTPTAPPMEDALPPLPTASSSERLSESLGGAINSIVVPQKREVISIPIPSQEPNLQPSEDQEPLFGNLQLPSAPPTIARPKPLQRAEPLKIPSTPPPPSRVVQKNPPAMPKSRSLQSPVSTPKAQPAVKPAPAIPSFSEVTPFKKSLPKTSSLKSLPAPNLEGLLKRSLPDMPTSAPVRRVPKVSHKRLTIQPDQKSSIPQVSAPPLVKIPEFPQPTQVMPPSAQPTPARPPSPQLPPAQPTPARPLRLQPPRAMPTSPKMAEKVKKLLEGLKSITRIPAPKPAPPKPMKPSPRTAPPIKLPPSELGQRIANLSTPEVVPVESIRQRLDQMHVQSLPDANASVSQPSPGENRYFAIIKAAINKRWVNPNVPISNKKVSITFLVEKSGEITRVHVEQGSGNPYYDSAILGAIHKARLPKFPSDLQKSFLNIKFLFTMPE